MSGRPVIGIRQLPHAEGLALPRYMTDGSAGMDVCAAVEDEQAIESGAAALVPTGLILEIPCGFEVQVRPRSGLALRRQVTILNAPGTIDSDYRGELQIVLINHGASPFVIRRGDRIAQLIVARVERAELELRPELTDTDRGAGGFGHSGR